jgi:hypothetical protein
MYGVWIQTRTFAKYEHQYFDYIVAIESTHLLDRILTEAFSKVATRDIWNFTASL